MLTYTPLAVVHVQTVLVLTVTKIHIVTDTSLLQCFDIVSEIKEAACGPDPSTPKAIFPQACKM